MSNILVIDDKDSMREMLKASLAADGYDVETAETGDVGVARSKEKHFDVILTDLRMPDISGMDVLSQVRQVDPDSAVIVMTAYGTIETAVEAMKKGAFDFLQKPFDTGHLRMIVERALENQRLVAENNLLREELAESLGFTDIIGTSEKMIEVMRLVQKVASSDTTILLTGESGTGKELFARAIHSLSSRKTKPYITINCAAIPGELLENELFGSEKGAFTSSHARKMGKFEIASGGTIFLDEIGDLEFSLQAKLLRVLQEQTFERLGGTKPIKVDVRIITATNMNLQEAITKKRFREDLFYRLSVFPIHIPPLRERREDIVPLASYFINKYWRQMKKGEKTLSREALQILERYHWPGNVRELENTIERAIILAEGKKIKPEHLAIRLSTSEDVRLREGAGLKEVGQMAQMQAERAMIIRVLNQTRGNKRKTADILQIDYTTLFEKIKKYEIDTNKDVFG
ncbi:MAG: sigma-54-dependent Fis family transcriptional regulator [candidate division Zixibacteria bacterium]|nr:sigma-54-dependent Fis family transcriptional regulator [candidate division Zixibacteria bacterium]